MYTDLFVLFGALEPGTTQQFHDHTMFKTRLAGWLLRQSQADSHVVKGIVPNPPAPANLSGNILGQVDSIAYQARAGPSRLRPSEFCLSHGRPYSSSSGKTGKTFRLPSNLVNASIESFAKGAPGATMLPGVQDRTIDNGLALALRPLIHPPRPLTKSSSKLSTGTSLSLGSTSNPHYFVDTWQMGRKRAGTRVT